MKRKRKRIKRRRRTTVPDNYRTDGSAPRGEYQWFKAWQSLGSPTNPQGIPWGLESASADPDATIAWICTHCKFAKKSCASPDGEYDGIEGVERYAEDHGQG